jgi:hypothetical protein
MKLDSVARAVDEHLSVEAVDESYTAAEKKSERPRSNRFFNMVFLGIVLTFIGIVIGVAGQGIWGAKTAAVILSLFGMLMAAYGFLPAAARYDRELLRSIGKAAGEEPGNKEMPKPERQVELPSGDDFEPVSKAAPVASITEGTTRNLDEEKIKVSR